eukprot:CAMPEP_0201926242 /NCGR_PEP_ID=MMETSP0903-20130614/15671_1 /ASSEMBLY_ACC=CAM_ASM_000552 /TAXON_ID=420261 /ORGANISM="Thalassiosira antarctica, Strain CCMP982" /LENGTH=67 /DNA_ID=CAMNT_0048464053 /DNA_START=59 /DNA_END=258 /DNA_ORIENTATION=-
MPTKRKKLVAAKDVPATPSPPTKIARTASGRAASNNTQVLVPPTGRPPLQHSTTMPPPPPIPHRASS